MGGAERRREKASRMLILLPFYQLDAYRPWQGPQPHPSSIPPGPPGPGTQHQEGIQRRDEKSIPL